MALLKFLKKAPKLELHALEPDETWYERAYWLALLAKELKAEVLQLKTENNQLLQQVHAGEPLKVDEKAYLTMRQELDELNHEKAKLEKRLRRYHDKERHDNDEETHDWETSAGVGPSTSDYGCTWGRRIQRRRPRYDQSTAGCTSTPTPQPSVGQIAHNELHLTSRVEVLITMTFRIHTREITIT